MTLTEFLLARIAEDEDEDRRIQETPPGSVYDYAQIEIHSIAFRVLAECEAKRRIVAWDAAQYVGYGVLEMLALPYADHPDYDEAWRP